MKCPADISPRRCRSNRQLLATALACAFAGPFVSARAQDLPTTPPPPAAPRPLKIDAPTELRLPNGLRVVVAQRPGVQLVTAQLLVLAGAETDPPGRAGLADMTASMLTKGSRHHTATQMASAAEVLGGSLDSGAAWDRSSVSITVGVPQLDAALGLVAEAVIQPTFAPEELDRLRTQALDGLTVAYTRPGTLASLVAPRLLFGAGPYGHPANGTPTSLPRLTRADLLATHAARFRPDNAVLVLAGDIDPVRARLLAVRHFGAWRAPAGVALPAAAVSTAEPARDVTSSPPSAKTPHVAIVDMPASGQASVMLVVAVPPRGADRAAADLMNSILGGGYSSRLNQEVRIKRGLSYGASSRIDARRQGGLLSASAQTKNESAAEVATLLQGEFDRLIATKVPDDELAARKATLIGGFSRGVETTAGLNAVVASLVVAGLPTTELVRRIPELSEVSAADVQRYAAANLGATGRRVVVAGEASRFAAALTAATPGGAAEVVTLTPGRLDQEADGALAR